MQKDAPSFLSSAERSRNYSFLSRRGELLSFFRQHHRQESRRFGFARVAGNRVELIRGLQEHLTGGVSLFGIAADFRPYLALENIGDRDPRMTVRIRTLAWRVRDLHHRYGPAVQ